MYKKLFFLISVVLMLSLVGNASAELVGEWNFNNQDANDSSGFGRHGVLEGNAKFTWDPGGNGKPASWVLDVNSDGHVNCGYIPQYNPFKSGTMAYGCWVLCYNLDPGRQYQGFIGNGQSTWRVYRHGTTDPGILRSKWNCPLDDMKLENPIEIGAEDPSSPLNNVWHHFVGMFDGTKTYCIVDGQVITRDTVGPINVIDPGAEEPALIIGAHAAYLFSDSPTRAWRGRIDDVRVYDTHLTMEEVILWMNGGYPTVNKAFGPYPPNNAVDVPLDVVLSWKPGVFANTHDVYFGAVFDDVNNADRTNPLGVLVSQNHEPNSYSPAELLQFSQTYYWRLDVVNAPPDYTVYKGDVWQFTTEPFAYPIVGTSITATASSQFNPNTGPENTINSSGLDENDLHSTDETAIWFSSMTGAQPSWIQYEFDKVYKLHQMWVWNFNKTIELVIGFGIKDATIEYSTDGANWATLGTTHEFARAPGAPGYAYNTTIDFGGVPARYVKITANSNWGGIMPQYGLSEVRIFHIPVVAREPDPAPGATDVDVEAVLSWRAGREAASHNVYFSADEQAVIDETISPVSIPAGSSYANYATGPLDLNKSYYWKVNEVNEAETTTTWESNVWSFTTSDNIVVEDFESYNDLDPGDPESNRIFHVWIDGYEDLTNGSIVGYAEAPFAEQTIVHEGDQSMPLRYDNSTASYSEATANIANLPIGQDWTKSGVKTSSLWFYGDPTNAAEQMYVKINGSKVTYDGDANNLTRIPWQTWNIDLADFGVNLDNVTELSIGLERNGAVGGSGVVYIDDIRLYPYSRRLITPAEPSQAGLVAHYEFWQRRSDHAERSIDCGFLFQHSRRVGQGSHGWH
ncbi:MAG: LamG-like jellyroll fold domain-containing protein [Planctomycetota bacterium]